ncbi:XRE family transcriptional regulator [Cuniculiplasma divulgatum]|uniref:XRE family transcriptional regulator fused to Zn peptidase n=1 Tax=Cuniculiplasma divulgatum TaxID=1673428 RepID=A0A1R4A9A6_9ARCH|nr:XRE family transcriptional regulator [Cuniculiplasma divulgatum]SJK85545.1 XRE family transcriptional regulator fused to Zn peptidase [Cuniculiplasma divulgatum]
MKSITVEVNPDILKWLRESSGWKMEEVGKRLGTSPETILEFETGKKSPTLTQLRVLSELYKRPLASFFLSKPKEEKPLPKDYRFLPSRANVFDKKTILAIRRSRSLQSIGKELSLNIRYETVTKTKKAALTDRPEIIAAEYRELFNLSFEKQRKLKDAYKLFGYMRDVLEDSNILVFQFSMPIEDARGFALADDIPSIVVINSKDSIEARLFTLMHEFGHILLGETVIDIPDESQANRDSIERWCNAFSASFLLPKESISELFKGYRGRLTETNTLNSLSTKYKVSKAVLLVKMLELDYISRQEFENVLARYVPKETKKIEIKKKGISLTSDQRCLSEMGNKFVSLVANNFDKDFITYSDALSYLSIKSKNFDKVLAKARK